MECTAVLCTTNSPVHYRTCNAFEIQDMYQNWRGTWLQKKVNGLGTSKDKSHYTHTTGLHFTIVNLEPLQMCHLPTRLIYPFRCETP